MDKQSATTRHNWYEIADSAVAARMTSQKPDEWDRLAQYLTRAVRRADWLAEYRCGEVPAYQLALMTLLGVQAIGRWLDGRTATGADRGSVPEAGPGPVIRGHGVPEPQRLDYVPPKEADAKPEKPLTVAEMEDPGEYRSNPGITNGGIGGYHPVLSDDGAPERAIWGIGAFESVQDIGGIPELAWYWSGSAFELGICSSGLTPEPQGAPSCSAPTGPNAHQTDAATLQRAIRTALRQIAPRHRTILELAYEDRMIDAQLVSKYGHGVAPLIARARSAKTACCQSPDGHAVRVLADALRRLSGGRKGARDDWEPLRRKEAQRLLGAAHDAYRAADGPATTRERKKGARRKRQQGERSVLFSVPVGSGKRKLFEAA